MAYILAVLKWIVVVAVLTAGFCILLKGSGVTIPFISFKGFEAHGVPIGLGVMGVGVLLAVFWPVEFESSGSGGGPGGTPVSFRFKTRFLR